MNCRVFILMRNIAYHRNFHRNSCATCAHAQITLFGWSQCLFKRNHGQHRQKSDQPSSTGNTFGHSLVTFRVTKGPFCPCCRDIRQQQTQAVINGIHRQIQTKWRFREDSNPQPAD